MSSDKVSSLDRTVVTSDHQRLERVQNEFVMSLVITGTRPRKCEAAVCLL